MRKLYHVDLTNPEREKLEKMVRKRKANGQIAKRSNILLAADRLGDKSWTDEQIAKTYRVSTRTIERLRLRLVTEGLEVALKGKPRLNTDKKKFDGEVESKLMALRCSEPEIGTSSWTLELLADKPVSLNYVESIGRESVRQILKKNEIKPWRVAEWVIPTADAAFVCAMEDVLEVYARPYNEKNPVVCMDESPKQLASELRRSYTDKNGVKHQDCEYKREGATELVMINEPLGNRGEVRLEDNHNGETFALTIAYIVERMYPDADLVTLVMDNLSSHKIYNLYKVFEPQRARSIMKKSEIVYTPKHGSWLNIAECELSVLSRQALQKRFATKAEVKEQVEAWAKNRNNNQKGVDWQFTTKDARVKLKKLYPTILT